MGMQLRTSNLTMLVTDHLGGHSEVRHTVRRRAESVCWRKTRISLPMGSPTEIAIGGPAVIKAEVATAMTGN